MQHRAEDAELHDNYDIFGTKTLQRNNSDRILSEFHYPCVT